jgi:hypothetical protein
MLEDPESDPPIAFSMTPLHEKRLLSLFQKKRYSNNFLLQFPVDYRITGGVLVGFGLELVFNQQK